MRIFTVSQSSAPIYTKNMSGIVRGGVEVLSGVSPVNVSGIYIVPASRAAILGNVTISCRSLIEPATPKGFFTYISHHFSGGGTTELYQSLGSYRYADETVSYEAYLNLPLAAGDSVSIFSTDPAGGGNFRTTAYFTASEFDA